MTDKDTKRSFHTQWATLSDGEGGHTIHGVALPPETTAHSGGEEVHFPSEEIEAAASSLEGESISVGHPDEFPYPVEETIGRITESAWDDDLGLVYEGVISDDSIARKINAGVLDVSAHILSNDGGETSDGAITAVDLVFTGLGVVSQGAAAGNVAESGPLALAASSTREDSEYTLGAVTQALGTNDGGNGSQQLEEPGNADQDNGNMTDDNDIRERVTALEAKVDEKDSEIDDLEGQLADERERAEELEAQLDEQTQDLKTEYAEALARESALSADALADAFGFESLKSQYEEAVENGDLEQVAPSDPPEPDVQSGAGGSSDGGAPSDADRERKEELEGELEQLKASSQSNRLVEGMIEARESELADITGE